jgi:hypothetical protein
VPNSRYNSHEKRFIQPIDDMRTKCELTKAQCDMLHTLSDPVRDSIVFFTSEGSVGLSLHPNLVNVIRVGDVVFGLFGVNLPFILRQDDSSRHYEMVNVAHVHNHSFLHAKLKSRPEGTSTEGFWGISVVYELGSVRSSEL